MNLIECREIINKLQSEHLPENYPLIAFYQRKEQKLIEMIKDGIRTELTACVRSHVKQHKK